MKGTNNCALSQDFRSTVQIPYGGRTVQRVVAVTEKKPGYFTGIVTKRGKITGRLIWSQRFQYPVFIPNGKARIDRKDMRALGLLSVLRDVCMKSKEVAA